MRQGRALSCGSGGGGSQRGAGQGDGLGLGLLRFGLLRFRSSASMVKDWLSSTGWVILRRERVLRASLLADAGGMPESSPVSGLCDPVCCSAMLTAFPLADPPAVGGYIEIPLAAATAPRSLSPLPLIKSMTT